MIDSPATLIGDYGSIVVYMQIVLWLAISLVSRLREENTIELGKVKDNECLWPHVWGWLDLDQKNLRSSNVKQEEEKQVAC
jgi:hypothetical protein